LADRDNYLTVGDNKRQCILVSEVEQTAQI